MKEKICPGCTLTRPESDFVAANGKRRYRVCLDCRRRRNRLAMRKRLRYNYAEVRALIVAHMGGRCARCGYAEFTEALGFYCRDGAASKLPDLINGFCYGATEAKWRRVSGEIVKRVLLCSNCVTVLRLGVVKSGAYTAPAPMGYPALEE